jgi:hypothetical protein
MMKCLTHCEATVAKAKSGEFEILSFQFEAKKGA